MGAASAGVVAQDTMVLVVPELCRAEGRQHRERADRGQEHAEVRLALPNGFRVPN
jgi:hypothetical protein